MKVDKWKSDALKIPHTPTEWPLFSLSLYSFFHFENYFWESNGSFMLFLIGAQTLQALSLGPFLILLSYWCPMNTSSKSWLMMWFLLTVAKLLLVLWFLLKTFLSFWEWWLAHAASAKSLQGLAFAPAAFGVAKSSIIVEMMVKVVVVISWWCSW